MNKKKAQPTKPPPQKAKAKSTASAGKSAAGKSGAAPTYKIINDNRKARHKYAILESLECGVILRGSEVKSLRDGKCQLEESYGRVRGTTLWLVGCDIAEYPQATLWNHEPKRERQLLVNKREMAKFINKAKEKGLTLVPLRMYFNERGIAKLQLGLAKGKKLVDKRETAKKRDWQRDKARLLRAKG